MTAPLYKYGVFGDEANCLDPLAQLSVYVPPLLAYTGKPFRLPFFVNRSDQALEYRWIVTGAPRGSGAVVNNPMGQPQVNLSGEVEKIAEKLGIKHVSISITHTANFAIASAVALAQEER